MENQHKMISGYRDLTEHEIALINEVKQHEAEALLLCDRLATLMQERHSETYFEKVRAGRAEALRWLAAGRHELQTACMKIVRAVAQPQPVEVERYPGSESEKEKSHDPT